MAFGLSAGAVSLIGGGLGLLAGGDSQQSQTASKEPWSAAAPWLRENLRTGQGLQNYYQQNPFNPQQQTAYQNIFGDLDAFRNQMAPGLMGFANRLMGSSYQRGGSTAGANGGGLLAGGAQPTGGMMGAGSSDMNQALQQLLSAQQGQQAPQSMQGGLFQVPQGQSYGKIDWAAQNPFTNGSIDPAAAAPDAKTVQELVAAELERQKREQASLSGEQYGGF